MRHIARRAIDFFRPGDEIPAGHYTADVLARLVEKGQVEAVDSPAINSPAEETPEATAPRRVEKRPAPRKRP